MPKPNRSDAHLPPEEAAKVEAATREYFEAIIPKRHTKPSRSEYAAVYSDALRSNNPDSIPELEKLRQLEAHPQKVVCNGQEVVEEYVETDYYKDLHGIDKQHHTTGTGFIKVEKANASSFTLRPYFDASNYQASCKGNPATNEWIPSADTVIPISNKPKRSDI
ncbi:hypothetical protein Cni_G10743 [Canna indica]|uniref:Maternal effect embryo arrest 59 n=1 Tax=Canna indica TaxID=4628 RepID=A0AAQ3Q8V0_9LILI|nr:hypothetical protein Cni_G10743 [Canna indica]